MKIQEFIITSLITSFLSIIVTIIFQEMNLVIFDFFDILLILTGIISAVAGVIITKNIFRFEFRKNTKDGIILGIISWIIYIFYYFIQFNELYVIDLVVLIGLFMGFFLSLIFLTKIPYPANSTTTSFKSSKKEFSILNTGFGIFPSIFSGGFIGFFVAEIVWFLFGLIQTFLGSSVPYAVIFFPPPVYLFGWIIVGTLASYLRHSSNYY